MRIRVLLVSSMLLAFSIAAWSAILGYIDFESTPAGTIYGLPGHPSGSLAFTESGVPFTLHDFAFVGGGSSYNQARIQTFSPGQALELNNIVLSADFSSRPASEITFEYRDFVGEKNLRVNGQTLYKVTALSGVPSAVAPGVQFSFTSNPLPGGPAVGTWGKVTLQGQITRLDLGGQEFFVDNLLWLGH